MCQKSYLWKFKTLTIQHMNGCREWENLSDGTRIVAWIGFVDASHAKCWISTFFSEVCSHTSRIPAVPSRRERMRVDETSANYANIPNSQNVRKRKKNLKLNFFVEFKVKSENSANFTENQSRVSLDIHLPHTPSYIVIVKYVIVVIPYYHIWHRLNIDIVDVTVKFKRRINFVMSLVQRILVLVSNVKFRSFGDNVVTLIVEW